MKRERERRENKATLSLPPISLTFIHPAYPPLCLPQVVLVTTKGDIEIELWAKECPKTCRNFIGLGMEGYYEGTTFHRIVPGIWKTALGAIGTEGDERR